VLLAKFSLLSDRFEDWPRRRGQGRHGDGPKGDQLEPRRPCRRLGPHNGCTSQTHFAAFLARPMTLSVWPVQSSQLGPTQITYRFCLLAEAPFAREARLGYRKAQPLHNKSRGSSTHHPRHIHQQKQPQEPHQQRLTPCIQPRHWPPRPRFRVHFDRSFTKTMYIRDAGWGLHQSRVERVAPIAFVYVWAAR
jgi:hypothetical protein